MTKLIIGNWKMYPTLSDSLVLAASLKKSLEEVKGVEIAVAPPTSWLVSVAEEWKHKLPHLHLAAQNVWAEDQGAYTGEVSAYFLRNIVKYAIIGHSERRTYNNEDNDLIGKKIHACLKWGITPIICVGERKKVLHEDGTMDESEWQKMSEQLIEALEGVDKEKVAEIAIAYEPIWAISPNGPAKPEYAVTIIERLKEKAVEKYGREIGYGLRILYGGSVSSSNVVDFLRYPEIAGLLVGSASVRAKDFIQICRHAATVE